MKYIKLPVWVDFLAKLQKMETISEYNRDAKLTYSHLQHVATEFVTHGFVTKRKSGRCVIYSLTQRGKLMAEACQGILAQVDKIGLEQS